MKYLLILMLIFSTLALGEDGYPTDELVEEYVEEDSEIAPRASQRSDDEDMITTINVVGQGVAPSFASSPALKYALAKKAAIGDAYRLLAERVKGVKIEGRDTIKNMQIKSSVVNTKVAAMIRNATIVETTYKDGMCEVEMELKIDRSEFR